MSAEMKVFNADLDYQELKAIAKDFSNGPCPIENTPAIIRRLCQMAEIEATLTSGNCVIVTWQVLKDAMGDFFGAQHGYPRFDQLKLYSWADVRHVEKAVAAKPATNTPGVQRAFYARIGWPALPGDDNIVPWEMSRAQRKDAERRNRWAAELAAAEQKIFDAGDTRAVIAGPCSIDGAPAPSGELEDFLAAYDNPQALAEARVIWRADLHQGALFDCQRKSGLKLVRRLSETGVV